jgi:hypothetical protein
MNMVVANMYQNASPPGCCGGWCGEAGGGAGLAPGAAVAGALVADG